MADTTTSLAATLQAQRVTGDFLLLLAERNALPNHPALHYSGNVDAADSTTKRVPHFGLLGYNLPTAQGSEDADQAATPFTVGNTDVAVVRHTKLYDSTDLLRMVQASRAVGLNMLAMDAFASYQLKLSELMAAAAATFTTVVGTTDVDMTVAQALTSTGALRIANVDASRGFMGLLHGYHWRDLIVDAGTGTLNDLHTAPNGALASMSVLRGGAFSGNWLGVDWFVSNFVPASGGDFTGGIFGYGGLTWADGRHGGIALTSDQALLAEGRVLFERDRNGSAAVTEFVSHSYMGVTKALEAGVQLLADGA